MSTPIVRALVVDDSALYRKFVTSVLEEIPGVKVVGTAANGRIGLEKIEALKPDLITLDQEMPELDGLGLLRDLSIRNLRVATIMISALTEAGARTTNTALQLGAFDFALKPTGKSVDESRRQLKADLTPKIQAFVSSHQHRKLPAEKVRAKRPTAAPADRGSIAQRLKNLRSGGQNLEIICIGVSTGGPAALNQLLPKLPADFPCPVVLVQHMPPKFTKSLADNLNRVCQLEVQEAANGMVVNRGGIYIAPGGSQMKVAKLADKTLIQITNDPPEQSCKPSVDYLFRSVAQHFGDRSLGVILTGMGEDGTLGCKLLRQKQAKILIQDEASCVVYGMPRSVFMAGLSDEVAPLENIAGCLISAVKTGATA